MATDKAQARIAAMLRAAFADHQQGGLDAAWRGYDSVLALDAKMPDALHLSGCVAMLRGDSEEAVRRIAAALEIVGANAMYLVSYGNALASLNRHADAEAAYRGALGIDPDSSAAHNNLGNLLLRLGRYEAAMVEFDRTLVCDPRHLNALLALGHLLSERKLTGPSLTLFRRARDLAPGDAKVLIALARASHSAGQLDAAIEAIEAARRIRPESAEAEIGVGIVLAMMQRFGESIASYRRALEIDPGREWALNGLVNSLSRIGAIDEAIAAVRFQAQRAPASPSPQSNLLFLLNYLPDISTAEVAAAHQAWNARWALPLASAANHAGNDRDPERRLRIGYVSTDFRTHSVSFFMEPILAHHDRSRFEIVAYHSSTDFDVVTQRLKASVDAWRDVPTMSDQDLAELIRSDRIDILVDLNGHTGHNRLLSFARQPAPVQVSYLGYPNTTGLTTIQYRISDAIADPPGVSETLSSETLLRLPDCFHVYRPSEDLTTDFTPPSASALPSKGCISFGSFNVVGKVSAPVVAAWAAILHAVPDSILRIKTLGLADPLARDRLREAFASQDIAAGRLVLESHHESRAEHMAHYRQIDIALDTFPYNGTTTTCDALWMGVPVITLRGDRHAACVGASLLHACGLESLVAGSVDDYVASAVALARAPGRLAQLHGSLRQQLRGSVLMDEPRFVRNLESAFRGIWRDRCSRDGLPPGLATTLETPRWQLRLAGEVSLCIPATLDAMTAAVLLEQEDWFEAEIGFVRDYLQAGMRVIDIGANYGIYTLNAARKVGVGGRVWAFEPAPNTRRFLSASVAANGFSQVSVEVPAVSDANGEAWIALKWNPELNSLVDGPAAGANTERIPITTLDAWVAADPGRGGAGDPDFIKMDAEGHERKVLTGGRQLLARASPLVMFEQRHAAVVNTGLIGDFEALGYGIYRLLPGLGLLLRFDPATAADPYELNLFACKPDLARKLATSGRLAEALQLPAGAEQATGSAGAWQQLLRQMPSLAGIAGCWPSASDDAVRLGLSAFAAALLQPERAAGERVALLSTALRLAESACAESPLPCRWHTLARIAWTAGRRATAVQALRQALAAIAGPSPIDFNEPFLPAGPEFDTTPVTDPQRWFEAATIARLLRLYYFSGYFADPLEELQLLERAAKLPHFAAGLERRRQLARVRVGLQPGPECSPLLAEAGPDNLNPEFWCR
jgi:FkbM family methyltransferase